MLMKAQVTNRPCAQQAKRYDFIYLSWNRWIYAVAQAKTL